MTDQLPEHFKEQLNQMEPFFSFVQTWVLDKFLYLPHRVIGLFTGNQSCKTSSTAFQYVMRIMGIHPVPQKNVLYFECPNMVLDNHAEDIYDALEYQNTTEAAIARKYKVTVAFFREWLKDYDERKKPRHKFVRIGFKSGDDVIPINICRQGTYIDPIPLFRDLKQWRPNITHKLCIRPEDNICPVCGEHLRIHHRKTKIIRFASENLPTEKETTGGVGGQSTEIKNAQYPEFKKWLPPWLVKKDITVRNPAITITDPNFGREFGDLGKYDGKDIVVEFVSYSQQVQAGAGVQRLSVWADEEAPLDWYEEQLPRLLAEDGDFINSVTPAYGISWTYDDIFEKANMYIRTKAICEYYKETEKKTVKQIEQTDSDHDIAVIQAATDDNPTLSRREIEGIYHEMPDPDGTAIATRRYGIFKQATGRIFKDFNFKVHVIDPKRYDISHETLSGWVLGRAQDFHTANNHAILWVAISPTNEAFVYQEWAPSPDSWITIKICNEMARRSGMDKFALNLIDPLSNTINNESGRTTIETMNDTFYKLKKGKRIDGLENPNACAGGYWEPWNTRGEVGRDEIKKRLANSIKVCKPFNNVYEKDHRKRYLPTLWVFKSCRETAKSLKHWRLETWANNRQLATKDRKEKPAQKFSHFCTALEALFKDKRFRPKRSHKQTNRKQPGYFKAA